MLQKKNKSYQIIKNYIKKNPTLFNLLKKYPIRYYRNIKRKKSSFPQEIWIENTNHCNDTNNHKIMIFNNTHQSDSNILIPLDGSRGPKLQ